MDVPKFARQLYAFKALGPYIREPLSSNDRVFFDCLSSCLDAEKSAELREFWGWWMELVPCEGGYHYNYWFGVYDEAGNWTQQSIPEEQRKLANDTLQRFFIRLSTLLENKFKLTINPGEALNNPQIPTAA